MVVPCPCITSPSSPLCGPVGGTLAAANLDIAAEDGSGGATRVLGHQRGSAHVACVGRPIPAWWTVARALTHHAQGHAVAPGALPRSISRANGTFGFGGFARPR